ncbi:MAG: peptidylprolyl isomerase [Bacteroidetes bacterium]|nr:peptidylprolyl isomerase [Bacteroidota bacterium]
MRKLIILFIAALCLGMYSCGSDTQTNETKVEISTEFGNIVLVLYNETPKHRDNFIALIEEGWYEGSPFHRVINEFMIQGGGSADGPDDKDYLIDAEIVPELFHKKGALAAARMGDNVNPLKESSACQFYIVQGRTFAENELILFEARTGHIFPEEHKEVYKTLGGTPHLDGGYTVFGEVISGLEVVDLIAAVETNMADRPLRDVRMSIRIID